MAKYLDSNGLSHLIGKIKTALAGKMDAVTLATVATTGDYDDLTDKPTIPSAGTGSSYPAMDGTRALGSDAGYARVDHIHPTDTSRAASDHTHGNITNGGDITATAPTIASGDKLIINDESASKVTNGPSFGTSTTTYLRNDGTWGTPAGTANQNAFSNVKVGSTTIAADTETDTLELAAGSNITLTPDATNDKITITAAIPIDTKNTAGSTNDSNTLYLIGAPTQSTYDQTYSNSYVRMSEGILYAEAFNGVKLNLSTSDHAFTVSNQYLTTESGIKVPFGEFFVLDDACAKAVDTSISSGSTSTNLPTSAAVANFVAGQAAGAATFKGTLVQTDSGSSATKWTQAELEAASYKKGWYWVVEAAGTYAGNVMEVGDMLFCVSDKSSAYAAADFTAIQNNIETLTTTEIDTIWAAA